MRFLSLRISSFSHHSHSSSFSLRSMPIGNSFEKANCVTGIIANSILLYLIRRHTRSTLGAYKQLLTIFAAYDLFLTTLHFVIDPKVLIVDTTFGIVSNSGFADRKLPSFYCASFTVPFTLMNIHFLYRYWAVSKPHLISLFPKPLFIALLVSIPTTETVVWFLICWLVLTGTEYDESVELLRSQFEMRHGRNVSEGWVVMDHWRNGVEDVGLILSLVTFNIIIFISIVVAVTLGSLTYTQIRRMNNKIASKKRKTQQLLLFTLTVQTAVPICFVYIPYFCALNFPFFGIPVGVIVDATTFLTSFFPAWDAVIVMLLMTDYRRALIVALSPTKTPSVPLGTQFTTSHLHHRAL